MSCVALLLLLFVFVFIEPVKSAEEDFEVILLQLEWNSSNATVPLSFTAFGQRVDLLLQKNENLLTPDFEVWKREEDDVLNKVDNLSKRSSCHYLYEGSFSSAAVSLCDFGTVHGFIFLENDSLEISPLSNEESNIFETHRLQVRSSSFGEPHVIKRRRIPSYHQVQTFDARKIKTTPRRKEVKTNKKVRSSLTIELAVFFDAAAYRLFHPHFSGDESRLLDMLLAYVNNIQALYYHPSLGERIDLALVRLELMQHQPPELAGLDGERGKLLDSFCAYSKRLNPPNDEDPRHWDMGLYISGLDFYALETDGKRNPVTMGLAPVGGVCWDAYSCVITEFGVTNRFGKPYPSAGFTSVYIAAHEIGHNLGMHHDSSDNDCPKDGYIMSPSRGLQGETHWSSCSRALVAGLAATRSCLLDGSEDVSEDDRQLDEDRQKQRSRLDHSGRFAELPGRQWSAKHQCELLLRDRQAYADKLGEDSCRALRCKSPNRMGFYLAGPALDGTRCNGKDGTTMECRAGECLPAEDRWVPMPTLTTPFPPTPGWSTWSLGRCESGCIRGSVGHLERRRTCLGEGDGTACPGLSFDVQLCKDEELCDRRGSNKRIDVLEYAGRRCLAYAKRLEVIDGPAGGLQAEHEPARPWMACAIFCKRHDIASYYTPRLELNDLGMNAYFPDGTWCHEEDGENYFCRRHHCLPENFRFSKGLLVDYHEEEEEEALGPMNAAPRDEDDWRQLSAEIVRYFSLDLDGRPLLTRLEPRQHELEDGPDPKDYVELPPPELLLREQAAYRRARARRHKTTLPLM